MGGSSIVDATFCRPDHRDAGLNNTSTQSPAIGLGGEGARVAIAVHAVAARDAVGEQVQRRVLHALRREEVQVRALVAPRAVMGAHLDRVGRDRHRRREGYLLPAGSRLAGERRRDGDSSVPLLDPGFPTWVPVFNAAL